MSNIIDINKNKPHRTESVICMDCKYDWQAVFPEKTNVEDLQCPKCNRQNTKVFDLVRAREIIQSQLPQSPFSSDNS